MLDSTDPAQIKAFENKVNLAKTLFIVSSKSGTTLEPNIFKQYFFERAKQTVGADKAGSRFIAITDPGSKMQQVAEADHFRHIFFGLPSIGGRYSALSNFGMVPARSWALDVSQFLARTQEMVDACAAACRGRTESRRSCSALSWGLPRNRAATKSPSSLRPESPIWAHGWSSCWPNPPASRAKALSRWIAKTLGLPRFTATIACLLTCVWNPRRTRHQDAKVAALEKAGHPVVRIALDDIYDLGQEFFRWEIATAVAGSIIGINAFNQPDVEASKIATRNLTTEYEKTGSLPAEKPVLEDGGIKLFTDATNAEALAKAAGSDKSLAGYLRAHLERIGCRRLFCSAGIYRDE